MAGVILLMACRLMVLLMIGTVTFKVFVTDGIENAVKRAKAAAGDKYVTVVGGANTAQQLA